MAIAVQQLRETEGDPLRVVDYKPATDALQKAFDELENVRGQLDEAMTHRGYELVAGEFLLYKPADVPAPTLADIGALWAFTDDIRAELEQLDRERNQIVARLEDLNIARLDAEARRRHGVAA